MPFGIMHNHLIGTMAVMVTWDALHLIRGGYYEHLEAVQTWMLIPKADKENKHSILPWTICFWETVYR
jgi:hypothetical protein